MQHISRLNPPGPPPPPAAPTTPDTCAKKCGLCQREIEPYRSAAALCQRCERLVEFARQFNLAHFHVPARYEQAAIQRRFEAGSYLLHGPAGTGKTHTGYALLSAWLSADRRMTVAAYSWPAVLMELRRSYGASADIRTEADNIVAALRSADAALLDDLGAEKVTEANAGWIREILFVILDERWREKRLTILTSNLQPEQLEPYLGDRILSRILGMCEPIPLKGRDRRLR